MRGLWGASFQNVHLEEMKETHQLHFSLTLPQFLYMPPPPLPLSIIDETSSGVLICHCVGCTRLWAAAADVQGEQLMPHEAK